MYSEDLTRDCVRFHMDHEEDVEFWRHAGTAGGATFHGAQR